jgi:hypothetical protein
VRWGPGEAVRHTVSTRAQAHSARAVINPAHSPSPSPFELTQDGASGIPLLRNRSLKPDGIANLVTVVVFVILDTIAVGLRLLAKKRNKRRLGSDDYWMLVALVFMYGWTALIIYCMLRSLSPMGSG